MINKGATLILVAFVALSAVVFALGSFIGRTNLIEQQGRNAAAACRAEGGVPVVIYGDTEVLCASAGKKGSIL